MKRTAVALTFLALVAGPVFAQEDAVDIEAEMARASRKFDQWIQSTRAFIDGITFDEGDVQGFLQLWPELAAIQSEEDEDEEITDYAAILDDPSYQAFAAEHQLNGASWLRKSVRILTMVMRDQMTVQLAAAEAQLPEQLEMIEGQRAQYGEEAYQDMKRSLEASSSMMKSQRASLASIPSPTASEAALLEQYNEDLEYLVMAEEDEEDWEN